jgi:hypothetical protein
MVRFALGSRVAPVVAVSVTLAVWLVGASAVAAAGWSVMRLPAGVQELTAVSCASASSCTAVGRGTEALRLARGRSSIEQPPNSADGDLTSVSCVSRSGCTAVGRSYSSLPLAERWLGASWSRELMAPFPLMNAPSRGLAGVSCTSGTACVAVGSAVTSVSGAGLDVVETQGTLVERRGSGRWSIQATPNPPGAANSYLTAVSCTSGTFCIAVGYATIANSKYAWPLIERLRGSRWSIERARNLPGAYLSELTGVSCTSATACTAVGWATERTTGHALTLVERFNGSRWSIERIPTLPPNSGIALTGVSCTSQTACTAVGSAGSGPLVERWNGASWSTERTPRLTGWSYGGLTGVSCASATVCTAVGNYVRADSLQVPLVERRNSHGSS